MLYRSALLRACCAWLICAALPLTTLADDLLAAYRRADQLLPANLQRQVSNLSLTVHWLNDGAFYYEQQRQGRAEIWGYRPHEGLQLWFDRDRLIEQLAQRSAQPVPAKPSVQVLQWQGEQIALQALGRRWLCPPRQSAGCVEQGPATAEADAGLSPDGRWRVLLKAHNLYLQASTGGEVKQLSFDGTADFPYASANSSPRQQFNQPEGSVAPELAVWWSKDSRYLLTFRLDLRPAGDLTLTQAVTGQGQRPRSYRYKYPMAGDATLPYGELWLLDMTSQQLRKLDAPPQWLTYYGDPVWGDWADNHKFYFIERERGAYVRRLRELDPASGQIRTLLEERNSKYIDPWLQTYQILPASQEFIWSSERDGDHHLYLYDLATGQLKRQLTTGEFVVRSLKGVDEGKRQLYYEASGRQPGDPYYRYLYRSSLDGGPAELLTPEAAMHSVQLDPQFRYLVDSHSTVQQPPKHLLRSLSDGKLLGELAQAEVRPLQQLGYRPPQPFQLPAPDGQMLYGVLYLPSNFNSKRPYPVLDDVYTGPHGYFTPKGYADPLWQHAPALAELGFVVLKMDGRGTAKRSRRFHDYSHQNLGGGVDDHVWALQQLAKTRPWLDLKRVGIYGFSAGGYDTAHALFKYPDFFKAGVAASGNHDFRADKTDWNETWMGYPVGPHWDEQSNLTLAKQLKGKLLLAHGELDDNVHPAATLQLADALMKANKDFELMIYPNMGHVLEENGYFVRRRWDFFVRHLLGKQPPGEYQIKQM